MSILSKISQWIRLAEEGRYSKFSPVFERDLTFTHAATMFPDPNKLYAYMHHYLHYFCPQAGRDHRDYFKQEQRGFGEDAFHAAWWLLFAEFKPFRMLEIGVYRGQVISLWALICKQLGYPAEIHGISPFSPVGDSVSSYLQNLDYMEDVLNAFQYWQLDPPVFVKALSTDSKAVEHIEGHAWDLVYIDGSHDFNIVLADYRLCRDHLAPGGILAIDDASLQTGFRPPRFSFAGHPGPSRVAREYADNEMQFLCAVGHINFFRNSSSRTPVKKDHV
jgi:cephalosporin hydroxylase